MRWSLVAFVVGILAWSAQAQAKLVIMEPTVAFNCRSFAKWEQVETCLKRHGKPVVVRQYEGVKLLEMMSLADNASSLGFYLYVLRNKAWTLGGMEEGDHMVLLDFQAVTINKHHGFRMELGRWMPTSIGFENGTALPAMLRMASTLYCGGDNYSCAQLMTLCEVYVRGKLFNVFRGTIGNDPKDPNVLTLTGDPTRGGNACRSSDRAYLGWAPN